MQIGIKPDNNISVTSAEVTPVTGRYDLRMHDQSIIVNTTGHEAHMSKKELLLSEIEQTPEPLLDEVLDYLRFLKNKLPNQRLDTAVASESALKKDWLRPEEDQAWQSL